MPDDLRFALASIDDPDGTEVGVILLGLDAERLLAGVGSARLADDDTALVTQAVDQARHEVAGPRYADLIAAGRARWRAVRASSRACPSRRTRLPRGAPGPRPPRTSPPPSPAPDRRPSAT